MTQNSEAIKEKIDKFDYIKKRIKTFAGQKYCEQSKDK